MGVQIQSKGERGRPLVANVNLVPFIDLLTVCITFLMVTAVWTQLSAIGVDQAVGGEEEGAATESLLTVHLRRDGLWMGRSPEQGLDLPRTGDAYPWTALAAGLVAERAAWPDTTSVVLVTDDGVLYESMIRALDLTRQHGFGRTLLGGGPGAAGSL